MSIKTIIEKHPKLWEIFKFLVIGGGATVIDFVVMGAVKYAFEPLQYGNNFFKAFITESSYPLPNIIGTGAGFLTGLIFNYIFSVIFVFSGTDTKKAKTALGFLVFAILSAIGLAIHLLGMYIGNDLLKINEWAIKVVLTLVVLVFNYFSRKYILFNKPKTAAENSTEVTLTTENTTAENSAEVCTVQKAQVGAKNKNADSASTKATALKNTKLKEKK